MALRVLSALLPLFPHPTPAHPSRLSSPTHSSIAFATESSAPGHSSGGLRGTPEPSQMDLSHSSENLAWGVKVPCWARAWCPD